MATVYVREHGAIIRKDGEQLRATLGQNLLFYIPMADLDQLILMGNVQITTQAAVFLMREDVDVVFMSQHGSYLGRLTLSGSKFAQLRHRQFQLCSDEALTLTLAREIVRGKINNQRTLLQRRSDQSPQYRTLLQGMGDMLQNASQANNLDRLRGYEGKAAAFYFEAIKSFFDPAWEFSRREYHPSPDPANALLSFVYTMLRKDVEAKIQVVGLDPYLGFFHTLGYDRPSLALDIMEEFRPAIADVVVLKLVTEGHLTLEDFERTKRLDLPIRLKKEALTLVIEAYELRLAETIYHPLANGDTSYRRAIELQVRQIARVVHGEQTSYQPLLLR